MSEYDFDRVIERRDAGSVKWNRYPSGVLPLWVADMDFAAPPAVTRALQRRVAHGIYGYRFAPDSLAEAVLDHVRDRYGWAIEADWLVWLPGTVPAIHAACRLVEPGAPVLSTTPIYPPFLDAPRNMGRALVKLPLIRGGGQDVLDLDRFEKTFTPQSLFLFCNPHNPTGRVFSEAELTDLAECALVGGGLIVSDELHADLVLEPGLRHRPLAAIAPELAKQIITLFAPSKTFNIAGLGLGYAVIPDAALRRRLEAAIAGILPYVNVLAYDAVEAAYREGRDWHAALIEYLRDNRDRVTDVLGELPGVKAKPPEGTYLYWMNLRGTGIENPVQHLEQQGVGLSDGAAFGAPGFARLNFACPRATLNEALQRIAAGFA
ncbi:MAG: PatB family C-S lyase [Gammaproteobacteria bacterium]|nr:PatB family C-S lyase [Gammaproteobacteria bacterium]